MRAVLMLVLVVVLPAAAAAQLPKELGDLVRKAPSLDSVMRGRPLESTFDDAVGPQPWLDRLDVTRRPGELSRLARAGNGGFVLQPGLWEGTFDSFCLRTATWAPGAGDGYLWSPIKGTRSTAIATILRGAVSQPQVSRHDIQLLLWAILSRTRVDQMPPRLQAAARALLPAREINAINTNGMEVLTAAEKTRLFGGLTRPVRQALEVESDLRYEFSKSQVRYESIEKIAVLSGAPPPENRNSIKRGQWSRHPGGYYVRYFPDSFARMQLQILVPAQVRIVRDRLNRIISIEDSRGGKTETTYDDTVAPRTHPRISTLRAYRFKSIRHSRRRGDGTVETIEIKDQGYAFHNTPRSQRRGLLEIVAGQVRRALSDLIGAPVEARQDWERWGDRAEQAQEIWDDAGYIRDRAEAATTRGDEGSIDALGDIEHYGDGIEAATTGDTDDRIGWITEMHERMADALEHAIDVLDGAPSTSTTDDSPTWDAGGGVAMPSGGGQTLGVSSR